jgi:anti-anti-sigma factor
VAPFAVHVERSGSLLTARLEGELDYQSVTAVDAVADAIDDTTSHVVLDVSGLTFCGSTGLRSFLRLKRKADQSGADFEILGPSVQLTDVLEITGLASVLNPRS